VAIRSIAEKIGRNAETLRLWVQRPERDCGARPGLALLCWWATSGIPMTTYSPDAIGLFKTEVIRRRGPWGSIKVGDCQASH
jgi:hypothetical protein